MNQGFVAGVPTVLRTRTRRRSGGEDCFASVQSSPTIRGLARVREQSRTYPAQPTMTIRGSCGTAKLRIMDGSVPHSQFRST